MKVLGITGGTGCGKTTLLKAAETLGFHCIDCDAVYHGLLQTCKPMLAELETQFPGAFPEGIFDRKALGRIVFQDEAKLQTLNHITHRYVKEAIYQELQGVAYAAIDAIALIESGLGELCDTTVAVVAPEEVRVARLTKRDDITPEYALLRIRAQKSSEEFSAMTDHTLCSDQPMEQFSKRMYKFY